MTYAFRPLSLKELQHALAIERGDEFEEDDVIEAQFIIDICAGLLTIDPNTRMVNLVHFTTKKYFDQHRQKYFPDYHEIITMECAVYLSLPALREATLRMIANNYPLACYAAQYMAQHARESPEVSLKPAVLEELCQLLSQPNKRKPLLALLDGLDLIKSGAYSTAEADDADATETSSHISDSISLSNLSIADDAADVITPGLAGTPTAENKVQQPLEVTALHLAASMGLTKVAGMLLNNTLDIDALDETGKTPLTVAMEKGFEKAVEFLIRSGAQVDLRTEHGKGVLLFAAERKWTGVRELIIERARNSVIDDTHVSLLIAANSNSPDIRLAIERIEESPGDQDTKIMEMAMFLSVELDHLSAVEALLQSGVDVNAKDHVSQTALHRATRCESESMIKALMAHGADIDVKNDNDKTPWRANLRIANRNILDLLLALGADPNTTSTGGVSELYAVAAAGDVDILKYLLKSGADPSIKTFFCWAPLHWAAHNDHIECVQLLIKAGADINTVSDQLKTPLDMALGCGHHAITELLVANGAKTYKDLQSPPDTMTQRPVPVSKVTTINKLAATTKVTFIFDQPLDEGYPWGQFIYIPEDTEHTPYYRPYQISHRLSTVTDSISIRVAQKRVEMAEYPLPPDYFTRQDVLYDIMRMNVGYPELKLRANSNSPLKGDLTIRRTWTGNWQVHQEDEQGTRRMLFRTIESNWSSANLDEPCKWNDEKGVFLATSTISLMRFERSLDRSLLDVLVSCWVAKHWSESLTRQEQETEKRV